MMYYQVTNSNDYNIILYIIKSGVIYIYNVKHIIYIYTYYYGQSKVTCKALC